MRPQARIIESGEILQGDDEVVIVHGDRRYRLRATRSGRLMMPGASPVLRRLCYSAAMLTAILAGYLPGLPMFAVLLLAFLPAFAPILEVVGVPGGFVYDNSELYERYCDWIFELAEDSGLLS